MKWKITDKTSYAIWRECGLPVGVFTNLQTMLHQARHSDDGDTATLEFEGTDCPKRERLADAIVDAEGANRRLQREK